MRNICIKGYIVGPNLNTCAFHCALLCTLQTAFTGNRGRNSGNLLNHKISNFIQNGRLLINAAKKILFGACWAS